jgi:hypothetical protein
MKFYILDANNNVVEANIKVWGRFFASRNRIVAQTEITDTVRVSTVFTGIDHRFGGRGPPLLFETMIFGGPLDQSQWRYTSYDDAETGHKVAVRKARAASGQRVTGSRRQR